MTPRRPQLDSAQEGKLDIYFDGSCAFCLWAQARLAPWDTRNRLRFLDYNDPQIAPTAPYTREELAREMHLREPGGQWRADFAAWVRILRALPALSWLGMLLGVPPLLWIGPGAYRFVARHRHLVPGVPPACVPAACAPPARRVL